MIRIYKQLFLMLLILPFITNASMKSRKSARIAPEPHLTIPAGVGNYSGPATPLNGNQAPAELSHVNSQAGDNNAAQSQNQPQSPFTRSGAVNEFSRAHGQSQHISHYKAKEHSDNKADAENPAAQTTVAPHLSDKEFAEYVNLPETRKKISTLISSSISHEKKANKAIGNNSIPKNDLGKNSFLRVFETMVKADYNAQILANKVEITKEFTNKEAERLWANKEHYKTKSWFCCC